MSKLFDLRNKTAVIIGGTSTLGAEMAQGLAEHGANIAIVGRNEEKGSQIVSRLNECGKNNKFFMTDDLSKDSLERIYDEVQEWYPNLDILINAPGTNSATPVLELEMDEWDSIMEVNLKSVVLSSQIFANRLIESNKEGNIINVSSVSSNIPLSKVFTYSASKAGVNSITKSLSLELASHNIRVNAIAPGFFPAEQNRKILSNERIESIMNHTPMKRFGKPEELKGATVWLASNEAASFVTGALIHIDGGFTSMTI